MRKVKIFMSDLHIGGGKSEDAFSPIKEERFCSLIKALIEKYREGSELILLGDIFDLIEQDTTVEKAMETALREHTDAIIALQNWLNYGNKIFYITGNHDHAVKEPHISEYLAKKLIADYDIPWGHFVIDDWYASKNFKLYAEHGHRFDIDNNHAGEETCFGDKVIKEFLMLLANGEDKRYYTNKKWLDPFGLGVTNPFEFLSNARPRGNILLFVQRLIDEGYLINNTKKDFVYRIVKIYGQNPNASALKRYISNNLGWLISDGHVRGALNDHYLPYRKNAREMMDKSNKYNIARLRDLSFKPELLIMGHTHFFDEYKVSKNCIYVNLSSWLDTIYIDNNGKLADIMKNCPFLICEKIGDKVNQTMYDASKDEPLSNPINWEFLKERRVLYDIPITEYSYYEEDDE